MENLLEAYLYANENFLDKLINISRIYKDKSGRIAQALVDIITFGTYIDDKYTKQNYFNVTDKEDLVSFSSDKKIKGFTMDYQNALATWSPEDWRKFGENGGTYKDFSGLKEDSGGLGSLGDYFGKQTLGDTVKLAGLTGKLF